VGGHATTDSYHDEVLKGFINTYVNPITNWTRAFSPTMYFGCNVEDIPTEQQVLNSVGSYGSQINRIIDVVSLLVPMLKGKTLSKDQIRVIEDFKQLARQADEASSIAQNKTPRNLSLEQVDDFVERLSRLAKTDPEQYRLAVERVLAGTVEKPETVVK
jgi:hypothetical protein